ncbi:hypothetical protein BJ508DRAFT_416718 [Ascobolus immersus RN42]|uniref:Uncharacterized protein n=1 Tax=Ascobolus immersus RN42 TaxID=1160509 RepID=A0A3N4I8I0_ASCIM|nr:hypothetical protein BJ508DRAFT_416718 [Ascobolus immersus RN42]
MSNLESYDSIAPLADCLPSECIADCLFCHGSDSNYYNTLPSNKDEIKAIIRPGLNPFVWPESILRNNHPSSMSQDAFEFILQLQDRCFDVSLAATYARTQMVKRAVICEKGPQTGKRILYSYKALGVCTCPSALHPELTNRLSFFRNQFKVIRELSEMMETIEKINPGPSDLKVEAFDSRPELRLMRPRRWWLICQVMQELLGLLCYDDGSIIIIQQLIRVGFHWEEILSEEEIVARSASFSAVVTPAYLKKLSEKAELFKFLWKLRIPSVEDRLFRYSAAPELWNEVERERV